MNTKRSLLPVVAFFITTLITAPAFATSFSFTFTFSGQAATGSGVLLADTTNNSGEYLVRGISGTVNGSPISQLLSPGTYPVASFPANDNMLFYPETMDTTLVDEGGLSFADTLGIDYNLYYGTFQTNDFGYQVITGLSGLDGGSLDSFSLGAPVLVPTPEPQSLILVASSLIGIFGLARRRYLQ